MKENRLPSKGFPDDPDSLFCFSVNGGDSAQSPGDPPPASVAGGRPYTLVFENDALAAADGGSSVIRAASRKEVAILFGILGRDCELHISPGYRQEAPVLCEEAAGLSFGQASEELRAADMEHVHDLLRKLPLNLSGLLSSPLAVKERDPLPERADRRYVHKKNGGNTLISEPFIDGRLVHFNLIERTEEFIFDHDSDHVQGMLLLEAMRQASIAVTHIAGELPPSGLMALSSYYNKFYTYIERSAPVVFRAFTSYALPPDGGETEDYAICQVFQWGRLVAEACLQAIVFMNHEQYEAKRERTTKISQRSKRQFDTKIDALLEKQGGL